MRVMVKRFALRHNGITYEAGQIIDLPDWLGRKLAAENPKEFALAEPSENVNADGFSKMSEGVEGIDAPEAPMLEDMTVQELKALAEENGIYLGTAKKRQDIIDAIVAASEEDAAQDQNNIPPAPLNGPLQ